MNLSALPKAEMESHLAELIGDQDQQIDTLKSERKLLWLLLASVFAINLLF